MLLADVINHGGFSDSLSYKLFGEERRSRTLTPYRSRWSVEQKIAIVMEFLNTNISVAELCRKHNVAPNAFY